MEDNKVQQWTVLQDIVVVNSSALSPPTAWTEAGRIANNNSPSPLFYRLIGFRKR